MTVGRPRKIDPDIILENAMQVFWEKGYEGSSMADIMRATGMHKGSLYQTFGDKKSLFMAALERYLDGMFVEQQQIIKTHDDPTAAIRAVLFHLLEYAHINDQGGQQQRGCMAVNSLVDSAPYDDDICQLLEQKKQRMIGSMVQVIEQIQAANPQQLTRPVEVVTALIGVAMEGLSIEMKNNMDPDMAKAVLDQQLQLLGI
ncbi:TetR/AcrR family transcriptional regulator [Marinicella meishanensis]|uniref:TetR/AcrR family transcriptional regulator n=1 Tax=Marinicella meishanensis TaxID=2873263 RepID=UPI001CC024EB|nr:TetR/AcrR family transcriptional regulator [Marinicella sp. NBU2979]